MLLRRILVAITLALPLVVPLPSTAQTGSGPVPERRMVVAHDTDFYGADIAQLFDTTLRACQTACMGDPRCRAFTFNTRSNACFPKFETGRIEPFAGAVSARILDTDAAVLAQAGQRAIDLDFLRPGDFDSARDQALELGLIHRAGLWQAEDQREAARQARADSDLSRAAWHLGATVTISDGAADWLEYARALLELATDDNDQRGALRRRSLNAAVNGYLRAGEGAALRAAAALAIAEALEPLNRGRDTIPALRLAQALAPRDDTAQALETAIGKFGFRVVEHRVDSDAARPRICAVFSEDLVPAGVDYAPFVQVEATGLAVDAEGRQLCLEGVSHGARYAVTLRAGLPAASGEVLARPATLTLYVRDRAPVVRFPGRSYVLPAEGEIAVPVETVNTDQLDLTLRLVSDRNLVRSLRDELFARPLGGWRDQFLADELAQEIWTGTAEVGLDLNREVVTRLPLGGLLGRLDPGIYVLKAAVPGTDPWNVSPATQWMVVSDLGLTTLWGTDGLHVVVRSLADAGPVPGAEVQLVSRGNAVLGRAATDGQGMAVFPAGLTRGRGNAAPALVTVTLTQDDGAVADLSFLPLTDPEFDLSDRGVEGRAPAPPLDVFLTTDRGAYRAGETVHVTALARDGTVQAVESVPLTLRLMRPDGMEYSRVLTQEVGAGGHVASLPIAGSAPRGVWRLEAYADVGAEPLTARTLLVEDFLPERIDIDLALSPEVPVAGEAAALAVQARYLFGPPAAGLTIEGETVLRAADGLAGFEGYSFGRHDRPFDMVFEPLPFGISTDDEGAARLDLTIPEAVAPMRPLELMTVVRVAEGSGRPVERGITSPIAPQAPIIGIRPLFEGAVGEGAAAEFRIVAVGPEGTAVPARLGWTLNRIETRYQWYQVFGDWNWEPVTTRSRIAEGALTLGDGPESLSLPVDWGRYELRLEGRDGPPAEASLAFNAGWYAAGDALQTPDMLEASLDRRAYAVGDTAMLRIAPREAGVALVSVLSDRVVHAETVAVEAGENLIPLTVTEAWGTGAYVAASVLRPMDAGRSRLPARALGLAHAAVDPGKRRLDAAFDMPGEASPRAPMDVALRVEGLAPGAEAFVTIAAVDLGILNLTSFDPPDPKGHYFDQRRLGVGLRDIYGRLIDSTQGAMGVVRSGGDAGRRGRLDAPPPTEELVALFSGALPVGADGMVRSSFDLPAFNGTVRLVAVVWSGDGVGQAHHDVLVRDPVVAQISLPRFLTPGDESRMLIELTHAKGPAGRVGIDIDAPEGVILGQVPSGVDLAEGGSARIEVPVTAQAPGLHEIGFAIAPPEAPPLTRVLRLPVQINDPEVARSSRMTLAPGQRLTLDAGAFDGLVPGTAGATLAIGPMARLDAASLMRMLDTYPYGCTEQVAAAAMPLLYLADVAEAMGLGPAEALNARIDRAIGDVLVNQFPNGSFGLWFPSSGDLWLDAFVTDFLSRARARGHTVPEPAFRMALDNLRNAINYAPDFDQDGAPYAYALMVLAREGAAAVGDLRYYADVKPHAFDTPLAAGQLGAALAAYGDPLRADRMFARAAGMIDAAAVETPVWRADYGSVRRDTAGLLTLAVEAGSDAVSRDRLGDLVAAPSPHPLSTQEATWTLLAAHALIDRPGTEGVTLGGSPVAGPLVSVDEARAREGEGLVLHNGSGREIVVTLTTHGLPDQPEPAAAQGYRITRRHFTLEGEPADLDAVAPGTRLVTVIDVIPFEDRRGRLIIDDPLPAGFEIDNPNLLRGGDLRALDWLELADVSQHAEFRQDRFLAAVEWSGSSGFRLGYVVRAVTPGSYHHPAAAVEDMYRPVLRSRTEAGRVTVTP